MNLPSEPTPPSARDPRILVLYGAPKVGKTTALAQLQSNLIVDNERGTDYISALRIQVNSVAELQELSRELKKEPMKYQRISLDTVTTLEDWAETLGTQMYRRSPTGKNFQGATVLSLPNGAGYLWLRMAFKELIELFSGVTGTLILVAHLREKMLEANGKEVSSKDIELTGKIRTIVCALADAVGLLYRKDSKLWITFDGSDTVACGSRCAHLTGQSFELDWNKIFMEGDRQPTGLISYDQPVA